MQRSSNISDIIPRRKDHPDDWREVFATKLEAERDVVLARIWDEIRSDYMTVRGSFAALKPARVADIGCGQAFVDLLIHEDTGAQLTLIDIEESNDVFFGFNENGGAGYASLSKARAFLTANGVEDGTITLINPKRAPYAKLPEVDVAFSFLSCGFHYPVNLYEEYFRHCVRQAVFLDIRKGRDSSVLDRIGRPLIVTDTRRRARVLVLKPPEEAGD
jgi:SAM-dependent methyltransferase